VEKRFPRESSFPLFFPRDIKVEKNFPREISFPPLNILFFPGQYFSAVQGKQNCSPGQFSFHDTKSIVINHFIVLNKGTIHAYVTFC
jgi:hypothetical protein